MKFGSTPSADGFTLMADFEHKATLLLFPYRRDVWSNIKEAQNLHIELIKKLSLFEKVYVGVRQEEAHLLEGLQSDNIVVLILDQDDAWIRDSGPLFVKKGDEIRMAKNGFNAWGGLYDDWGHDLKITEELSKQFGMGYYENDFILEGGNITTDGKGTAILVENCVANPNRNSKSKAQLDVELKTGLGLKKIIWLKDGFVNDETGGHIDNVCRFLPDGRVCITWTDKNDHPMYARCRQIERELKEQAPELVIEKLVTPESQFRKKRETVAKEGAMKRLRGELLTASYINYYETDNAVFIPAFGVKEDDEAREKFESLFEGRQIIPLYTREYILAGGGLHCLTLGVNF